MYVQSTRSAELSACVPLAVSAPTATPFPWVARLRDACATLAHAAPAQLASISVTAWLETCSPEEADCVADTAQVLADLYGVCATITLHRPAGGCTVRFCRCSADAGPHTRAACRSARRATSDPAPCSTAASAARTR